MAIFAEVVQMTYFVHQYFTASFYKKVSAKKTILVQNN